QVVFHAQMAEEQNAFAFGDVVEAITRKMIRRHPHVFAIRRATSPPPTSRKSGTASRPRRKPSAPHAGRRRKRPRTNRCCRVSRPASQR
ncbi:hypothetical protein K7461_29660, partial [Pseudomonas fluorescens]|nr:hypothetical protein [Pseudomonas fluorescens]